MANFDYDGIFIERDDKLAGHLKSDGPETSLTLSHSRDVTRFLKSSPEVFGNLSNGLKASLIDCIITETHSTGIDTENSSETKIFPNLMILGQEWVSTSEKTISEIVYYPQDIDCLSGYNTDFGTITPTKEDLKRLLDEEDKKHKNIAKKHNWEISDRPPVKIGDHPELLYYSGIFEIVEIDSKECKIEISNRPTFRPGTPKGVKIENQITLRIILKEPKSVSEVPNFLNIIHTFLELCLGKRQKYREIKLQTSSISDEYSYLDLHWSYANERNSRSNTRTSQIDVLTDMGDRKAEFSELFSNWMETSGTMNGPRQRFASCFFSDSYGIDRIVGASNMFDLLPEFRTPQKRPLDTQTQNLVKKCRAKFKELPESFARQEVLSALGRVGRSSLRDKIKYQVEILERATGARFKDILIPSTQGVICRNHFVHGSPATFDYDEEFSSFVFITDTLEFVFAISDFLEMGWSFESWAKLGTTQSHPFGRYIVDYDMNLIRLKDVLARKQ